MVTDLRNSRRFKDESLRIGSAREKQIEKKSGKKRGRADYINNLAKIKRPLNEKGFKALI